MKRLEREEFTAKYCAEMLALKKTGTDVDRIGATLFNSKITLTPHQIQAALFAFKSPLRKGVILADEVGLGKTIEAGIVIAQTWFEKKGKVLIIAPAALLKQWQCELQEKFGLESSILDRRAYNQKAKQGYKNPIKAMDRNILICSYQMCSAVCQDIRETGFDLVIIDEAHKLRNVHNEKSLTANNIKYAVEHFKKVLLTATPIQNNLMDLYGLSSIIDEDLFGDKSVFRYNYIKNFDENEMELEYRLKNVLHRTLRNQVQPYIQFTNRIPKTFAFELTDVEKQVYEKIRELLNTSEEESYLIPKAQRHLLVLILCKLMGSSMHSIVYTLEKMRTRLLALKNEGDYTSSDFEEFDIEEDDFEITEEMEYQEVDIEKLDVEIRNLEEIIELADSVTDESKYGALINALQYSFLHLAELGAEEKVLIFTESRRTQDYLYESLKRDGYGEVLLYNGTNNSDESKAIYDDWLAKHPESLKNSRAVNMRAAILERFKSSGKILIATEAGAEGLNLQFCSLVINYDLPWNPQRVEQRIGRCHRFGQKFDVAVINFISSGNAVEQRIYELLHGKFRLFDEILGSSDTILGSLEDGKDIENAIVNIYASCRTTEEINAAFDALQEKYKDDISESMKRTREELLNNFEEDVQQYFKDVMTSTEISISKIERLLWKLLIAMWKNKMVISDEYAFTIDGKKYCLSARNIDDESIGFNLTTELGQELLNETNRISIKNGHIVFKVSDYPYKMSRVSVLIGRKGYLSLNKISISSFETEEYLVFNGILDDGTRVDPDICEMLFRVETEEFLESLVESDKLRVLEEDVAVNVKSILTESESRNNQYLNEEIDRINAWADDKIQSVQMDVENMRAQRKELQKQSDLASNAQEKENIEKEILRLSKRIKQSWLQLAYAEEEVEEERKRMIDAIRQENMKEYLVENVFCISFAVE